MDLSLIDTDVLITGGGGILVLVAALFIFRSISKNTKPMKNEPTKDETSKNDKPTSSWKIKRSLLKRMRNRKKKDEMESIPGFEVDVALIQSENLEPVVAESVKEDLPQEEASVLQEVLAPVPAVEETTLPENQTDTKEGVSMDELFSDLLTTSEEKKPVIEPEPEKQKEEEKKAEKPASSDIFSMFSEEEEEEVEMSKFAKSLDPLDINVLLSEVREIRKYMRK